MNSASLRACCDPAPGFLAQAERHAAHIREALGLGPADPVDIRAVARQLGVRVVAADELIDPDRLQELERIQAFAFSACTLDINGVNVVVFNPLRSPARTQSDIAHEVSHLLLGHDLDEVRIVAGMPFRTCRPDQEEEATNLGGTLLLPRLLLRRAARQGLGVDEIAEQYGVTLDMAPFRFNKTGVARQTATGGRVIAERLGLRHKTVRNHVSNIFSKLQVADRAQAIVRARQAGLGATGSRPE